MKLEFSPQSFEKSSNIKLKSIQREASCSMWAEGQTDTIKLIVAFCNFANAPKSGWAGGLATSRFAGGAGVNVVLLALFTVTFSPSEIL